MNILLTLLVCVAILISILTIGFLILWVKGVEVIALPGLGVMIWTPFMVGVLLVVEVVIVVVAIFAK